MNLPPKRLLRLKDTPCWKRIPPDIKKLKELDGYELALELTQGYWSLISPEDIELSEFRWYAHVFKSRRAIYAGRKVRLLSGKQKSLFFHREIIAGIPSNMEVDHKDQGILMPFKLTDNRRLNVRAVTCLENQVNKRKAQGAVSKYKGVYWDKRKKKWRARIQVERQPINLGSHATEIDAAKAYNENHALYYPSFPEGQNRL